MGNDKNTYRNIHRRLCRNNPKLGICAKCEKEHPRTHWALLKGKEYSENIEDYWELCPLCHKEYDKDRPRKKRESTPQLRFLIALPRDIRVEARTIAKSRGQTLTGWVREVIMKSLKKHYKIKNKVK